MRWFISRADLARLLLLDQVRICREVTTMHRIVFAILMLVVLGLGAACNTVRGVGQDVERAGEKTQDAAEAVRRRL